MATSQSHTNSREEKTYDFKPIDCDVNAIEPDAAEGKYEAIIDGVRVQGTSSDNFPMLVLDWKMEKTDEDGDEYEKSIGAIVADFIPFFPDGDKRGKMSKLRFRQLRELLGISDDILPKRLESKQDFADLISALKRQRAEVFVTHRPDKNTGEVRVGVSYTEPKAKASLGPVNEDDDDKPAPRKASGSKASGGKSRR